MKFAKNFHTNKNIMKNEIIDIMIQLLEYAKTLPTFSIAFDIKADNKSIEEFIESNVSKTDWFGNKISDKVIQDRIKNDIEFFRNSRGYDSNGNSIMTVTKYITPLDITFEKIQSLVNGSDKTLPAGYKFCNNVRLREMNGL